MNIQEKQTQFFKKLRHAVSQNEGHNQWALTYEEEVSAANYKTPEYLTKTALDLKPSGNYLDIGCGNGLVGAADQKDCEKVISELPVNLIKKVEQPYHDAIQKMFNIVLHKIPV